MEDEDRFCQRCGTESVVIQKTPVSQDHVPQQLPAPQIAQPSSPPGTPAQPPALQAAPLSGSRTAPQYPPEPQNAPLSSPPDVPAQPPALQDTPPYNPRQENGWQEDKVGTAPMACGVLGLLFALLFPILGLIVSIVGLVLANSEISSGKTTKTYGRTLNGAAIGLVLIQWAFVLFMALFIGAGMSL